MDYAPTQIIECAIRELRQPSLDIVSQEISTLHKLVPDPSFYELTTIRFDNDKAHVFFRIPKNHFFLAVIVDTSAMPVPTFCYIEPGNTLSVLCSTDDSSFI